MQGANGLRDIEDAAAMLPAAGLRGASSKVSLFIMAVAIGLRPRREH